MASKVVRKVLLTASDVAWGTGTIAQTRRRGSSTVTTNYQRVNIGHIPLTPGLASLAAFSSAGVTMADAAISLLASGGALPVASTTGMGIAKVSCAPALPTLAIAVGDNDPRVLTQDENDAVGGLTGSNAPSSTNPLWTQSKILEAFLLTYGSGKDGPGKLGAISDPASAPTVALGGSGNLTGSYTYKAAAYNVTGTTVASSASATVAPSAQSVTITLPAIPTNATGWALFRSSDGVNWYFVGRTLTTTYVDNSPARYTSSTAPSSNTTSNTWNNASGEWHFTTFTITSGQTITYDTSGINSGLLEIRCTESIDFQSGATISGDESYRVNFQMPWLSRGADIGTLASATVASAIGLTSTGRIGGQGLGAARWMIGCQAPGKKGSAGAAGGGGAAAGTAGSTTAWPGATLIMVAPVWVSAAGTVNLRGGNGSAGGNGGTASGSNSGGGGGGGASGSSGGVAIFGSANPQVWSVDLRLNGGNGGNGGKGGNSGSGTWYGGSGGSGGGGGGGGLAVFVGPCWDTSSGTIDTAGGSAGSAGSAGTGAGSSGGAAGGAGAGGGACSGNGGNGGAASAATAAAGNAGSSGATGQIVIDTRAPYASAWTRMAA